ncbi:3D-(3,5/4)-trihydroxycyclohexane-1,2-dione acylhydrolase (decyclizing) [Actinomadura citrea]|uniref:3D-(3,5/4)-trihydroxycyclohexane-1,2-dione acylhydrolase (Decyclizing) n=3 Tax=Actinomadura citrea TaxID=46158 RepID=A0A7Y9GDS2_9ACTN|nr:3D-(3,5/4)-trihydroxycyclohexane-1,2-dione acylhydrolase (decyclizing) [Actinomadura citrea]NYE14613.1 3D-(3,5/4)-trihydroxycyclohexane-1,2-dione acylhydrolase (decyclizing) [Actinomadura citrea]
MRLTVSQALVRFLSVQYSERDGVERRFFAGCFGIFGHGNVAGMGQALLEHGGELPYYMARNEQAMVHAAAGFARMSDRLSTLACTTSIGPGATNMVTGAALATVNRLPVLLLPGDVFATRAANPVLQELEDARSYDVSVNDCFKPVSRYWDRINRAEQLPGALLAAMRVLTDPAETGAVTLALPQDVQAEAFEWPQELFARRVWRVGRAVPEPAVLEEAAAIVRGAERPLIVAGGGVIYSGATGELGALAERTGVPVAETQAGKGSLAWDHRGSVGAVGATGTTAANALAREADVVIGIGTRYSDFTTASHSLFAHPSVRFVNINVARADAVKLGGLSVVADAREAIRALDEALAGYTVPQGYRERARALMADWNARVERACAPKDGDGGLLTQAEVIGAVNEVSGPRDVVVCAAGSMPGDLHKLWRARDPKGYHVEYGYSCMGYEIAGGLGVKMAAPDREVFVLVGDGSYLMMAQELTTAAAEGIRLVVVLVQNHGYASIGNLSESVGAQRFGTRHRLRTPTGLDGDPIPLDLAANAASLGADVIRADDADGFRKALRQAIASPRTTVVHVETDPLAAGPGSEAWWDVPVAEVSELDDTRRARAHYDDSKKTQRRYL